MYELVSYTVTPHAVTLAKLVSQAVHFHAYNNFNKRTYEPHS